MPTLAERWIEECREQSLEQGGVLIHWARGRDRTGIISLLSLALLGVQPEASNVGCVQREVATLQDLFGTLSLR